MAVRRVLVYKCTNVQMYSCSLVVDKLETPCVSDRQRPGNIVTYNLEIPTGSTMQEHDA